MNGGLPSHFGLPHRSCLSTELLVRSVFTTEAGMRVGHITLADEELPAGQHGYTYNTDNIQHGVPDGVGPILRQGQ